MKFNKIKYCFQKSSANEATGAEVSDLYMHELEEYLNFDYGKAMAIAPQITRVIAENAKPLTLRGTNSYLVGEDILAIIDPGPALPSHIDALQKVINGRKVAYILVTHSHVDHSGAAAPLAELTGATVLGYGPLPNFRPTNAIEADYHFDFRPEERLQDGDQINVDGHVIEAIHTPGHFPNHLCFALKDKNILFSGDHVLGWSSTVVAPPIGDMRDYLLALDKLSQRTETTYLPGHGPVIQNSPAVLTELRKHRTEREAQVLSCLEKGIDTIEDIVDYLYETLNAGLYLPACKSVEAHILHLRQQGLLPAQEIPMPRAAIG